MDRRANTRKTQKQARRDTVEKRRRADYLHGNSNSQFRVPTTVSFPANIIGFPDRLKTTLKYSEQINFTSSATPSAQVFTINSAFDPNNSGSGHQASFYDTFTGVYARYFVEEFQLDVILVNETSVGVIYSICYGDRDISGNTVEQISESRYALTGIIGGSSGMNYRKISMPWMTSAQLMGMPRRIIEADDNMYAGTGSNPADLCYGIIKIAADDASTAITVRARCVLTQRVVFKDLLGQVSS